MKFTINPDVQPILLQQMLWDIVPCSEVPKVQGILQLVPASSEVTDLEHTRSHVRTRRTDQILNPIQVLATMGGGICASAMLNEQELDPMLKAQITAMVITASMATAQAVVANLLDIGVLQEGPALA